MTAKTELELENQALVWDEEVEDEELYYFYDDEQNWRQLREERDDMPNKVHNRLVDYLIQVLSWLYRSQLHTVEREISFYQTANSDEKPLYPDVFVLKGQELTQLTSYRLGVTGPPPNVFIEIVSTKTRRTDLEVKPKRYEKWGVAEYFVYDPRPCTPKQNEPRLYAWRLVEGKFQPIEPDNQGRMWSEQLVSWFGSDGAFVRLYDEEGNQRLTQAERLAARLRELGEDPNEL